MAKLSDSLGRFYIGSVDAAYGGYAERVAPCWCHACAASVEVARLAVLVRGRDGRSYRLSHVRPESLQVGAPESADAAAGRFLAAVL